MDNFQEALERARMLAAKIAPCTSNNNNTTNKRTLEDEEGFDSEAKRLNIGAKLAQMKSSNSMKPQRNQLYLNGTMFNGEKILDIMIPGNRVGIIIGKSGDMIRRIQEKAGVKMVIYQESNQVSDQDKQLRISGPEDKVDYAEQIVKDLLVEKEIENVKLKSAPRINSALNEYGSSSRITYQELAIPPNLIGLVIGKSGETIRRIQGESSCRVQFDTTKTDNQGNKICQFTGPQDCVNQAMDMVKDIINKATGGQGNVEEIRLVVPASKTGSVIGRGGENIRIYKAQSGCSIELDKSFQSDNNDEKCFIIRGPADKVPYAQQLVTDKVGGHATVISSTMANNSFFGDNPYSYLANSANYANQIGSSSTSPSQYFWPGQNAGMGNSNDLPSSTNDTKSTTQDQYSMWAAYYAQYYAQNNGRAAATESSGTEDTANKSDTSSGNEISVYQQWIQYYKAYNMTNEAEAMEAKLQEYIKNKSGADGKSGSNGQTD